MDMHEHARASAPKESCGLLLVVNGLERYLPCENLSANPEISFQLDEELLVEYEHSIVAIVHSHAFGDCFPSGADSLGCEETGIPWKIIDLQGGAAWIYPSDFQDSLIGRIYEFGVFDCFTVIRDYYAWTHHVTLPNYTEDMRNRWLAGEEVYLDMYHEAGFRPVDMEDLQEGDLILFGFPCPRYRKDGKRPVNHAAVYLGNGVILHHTEGHLSSKDLLDGYYLRHARMFLRHQEVFGAVSR